MKNQISKSAQKAKLVAKNKARIEKAKVNAEKNILKRKEKLQQYYEALKEKRIAEIKNYYYKKLEKRLSKIEKKIKRKVSKKRGEVYGYEIKKVEKSDAKIRRQALEEIQLYSKLSRLFYLGGELMIRLYDKNVVVKATKDGKLDRYINGGHVYGQKNYPHLAFDLDNIRPISSMGNKMQGDQVAQRKDNIGQAKLFTLELKAEDKEDKNKIRDRLYYQEQYDLYKEKNDMLLLLYGLVRGKQKKG